MSGMPSGPGHAHPPGPDVLRRRLRVISAGDGQVVLDAPRAAACKSCAAREGCGSGALSEMLGGGGQLTLRCDEAVEPGAEVDVVLSRAALLGGVARAYLWPSLALVTVATGSAVLGLSDALTALLCLPALAAGFLPLLLSRGEGTGLRIDGR